MSKKNKPKPLDLEEIKKEIKEEVLQWLYKEVKQPDKYLISIALGHAIRKTVERIRKACEFYLRYKDNPELLIKEHPKHKKEIEKIIKKEQIQVMNIVVNGILLSRSVDYDKIERWMNELSKYNEWLFRLAFRVVFEDVKND